MGMNHVAPAMFCTLCLACGQRHGLRSTVSNILTWCAQKKRCQHHCTIKTCPASPSAFNAPRGVMSRDPAYCRSPCRGRSCQRLLLVFRLVLIVELLPRHDEAAHHQHCKAAAAAAKTGSATQQAQSLQQQQSTCHKGRERCCSPVMQCHHQQPQVCMQLSAGTAARSDMLLVMAAAPGLAVSHCTNMFFRSRTPSRL
jgi:hypothetical protein